MTVVATGSDKQYRLASHYLGKLRSASRVFKSGDENASYALNIARQDWLQIQHWQAWVTAHAEDQQEAAALCSAYPYEAGELLHLMLTLQEHRTWREAALVQAQRLDDSQAQMAHHLALGIVYEHLSDETLANEHALQALTLAEQVNDQNSIGQACLLLGDLTLRQGSYIAARGYLEQSLRCFRPLYRSRDLASALHSLAEIAFAARELPLCQQHLTEALDLYQQSGDGRGMSEILRAKRYWFDEPPQLIEQVDLEARAHDYLQLGDRFSAAGTLMSLADNALSAGNFAASERYISERLKLHRQLEMPRLIASGLHDLGVLCMIQERYAAGRDYLLQGVAICRQYSLLRTLSRALLLLALAYWGVDDLANLYIALQEGFPLTLTHAPAGVPLGIAAFAALRLRTEMAEDAAVLIGVADAYPGTEPDIRAFALSRLRQELANTLDSETLIAALDRGAKLDFDATVAEIIAELSS